VKGLNSHAPVGSDITYPRFTSDSDSFSDSELIILTIRRFIGVMSLSSRNASSWLIKSWDRPASCVKGMIMFKHLYPSESISFWQPRSGSSHSYKFMNHLPTMRQQRSPAILKFNFSTIYIMSQGFQAHPQSLYIQEVRSFLCNLRNTNLLHCLNVPDISL
jgi:hypothetical protein